MSGLDVQWSVAGATAATQRAQTAVRQALWQASTFLDVSKEWGFEHHTRGASAVAYALAPMNVRLSVMLAKLELVMLCAQEFSESSEESAKTTAAEETGQYLTDLGQELGALAAQVEHVWPYAQLSEVEEVIAAVAVMMSEVHQAVLAVEAAKAGHHWQGN